MRLVVFKSTKKLSSKSSPLKMPPGTADKTTRVGRDDVLAGLGRKNRMLLDVAVTCPSDATVFLDNPPGHGGRTETARRLMMGDVARVDSDAVTLDVEVVGSAPIERLDILRGREVLETVQPRPSRQCPQVQPRCRLPKPFPGDLQSDRARRA